jgi:hypothetical protein
MDWKYVFCEEIDDFEWVTYMNIGLKEVKRWLFILFYDEN